MIIAFGGKKRAGKGTMAEVLVKKFGYTKVSFADGLRNLASNVFGLGIENFTEDNLKEQPFTNPLVFTEGHLGLLIAELEEQGFHVDENAQARLASTLGTTFNNPRHLLQVLGTDIIRKHYDDQIFLKMMDKRLGTLADIVIDDMRFAVERDFVRAREGVLCLVNRPNLNSNDSHSSENELGSEQEYQVIIHNDADKYKVQHDIEMWFYNYLQHKRKASGVNKFY